MTTMTMRISLPGVLERAAARVEKTRDMNHLAYPLRQLLEHLRELKERPAEIDRFFEIWDVGTKR